jgi:hypothetical protein
MKGSRILTISPSRVNSTFPITQHRTARVLRIRYATSSTQAANQSVVHTSSEEDSLAHTICNGIEQSSQRYPFLQITSRVLSPLATSSELVHRSCSIGSMALESDDTVSERTGQGQRARAQFLYLIDSESSSTDISEPDLALIHSPQTSTCLTANSCEPVSSLSMIPWLANECPIIVMTDPRDPPTHSPATTKISPQSPFSDR